MKINLPDHSQNIFFQTGCAENGTEIRLGKKLDRGTPSPK